MRYYEIIQLTNENAIPGHMGLDFIKDVSINPDEVIAQYRDCDQDLEATLNKLETFNPSWRFLIDQNSKEWALAKLKSIIDNF